MGAVLHAVEVPAGGGDTLFCDMAAAYDGLPDDLARRIDGLVADPRLPPGLRPQPDRARSWREMREQYPPVEHPVVRTHPETGRKLLYVNRFFTGYIVGPRPPTRAPR